MLFQRTDKPNPLWITLFSPRKILNTIATISLSLASSFCLYDTITGVLITIKNVIILNCIKKETNNQIFFSKHYIMRAIIYIIHKYNLILCIYKNIFQCFISMAFLIWKIKTKQKFLMSQWVLRRIKQFCKAEFFNFVYKKHTCI